ncbi:tail fiber assembly protein [Serratia marcescens]|uniref:tail fiber assembly protein n=1 Tax=Serratia marcescens TaxID=615 RepID=UPI001114A4A5
MAETHLSQIFSALATNQSQIHRPAEPGRHCVCCTTNRTQLMLGMISDADKKLLITWMEYVQKIQELDGNGNEVVIWTEPPK